MPGGILDYLENNWQQMLGLSPAEAATASAPPPPPPPGNGGPPLQGGGFGGPPVQTTSLGPSGPGPQAAPQLPPNAPIPDNASFAQRAAPMQSDLANGAYDGMDPRYNDFQPNSMRTSSERGGDFSPDPNMSQPHNPGFAPPMSVPPMPTARPAIPPNGGPVQVAGPPMYPGSAAPPPPPGVMNQNGAPPVTNTSGSLASSMGLNQNALQAGFAGLGKGLSAVGAQRPGATAGASFAAGAGGAITGSNQQTEKQQAQALQQKKLDFDESLATKNYDISKLSAAIRQRQMEMQIPWWQARADVLKVKQAQDSSSKAWQMSEPGRYHTVDNDVAKYQNGLMQQYRDELKQATLDNDPDKLAKIRDIIKQGTEEFRQQKYKEQNLDPNKAETVKQRGFEGTEDQIKHLPPGTRFWDPKAGVTRTRKADPDSTPIGADQAAAAQPTQAEQMTASPEE